MKITLNRFLDLFAGKNKTFKEAREFRDVSRDSSDL
jgi:hypothetical protein